MKSILFMILVILDYCKYNKRVENVRFWEV